MTEFWLISAPGEKTCQQTWDKMMAATTRTNNLSTNHKFSIPDLKVGTLDVLVGLSDELAKLDSFVESVVKKVAQYMADVLEDSRDKVQETCWPMELILSPTSQDFSGTWQNIPSNSHLKTSLKSSQSK
ncbi:V-type proton ATPase subunit C 1-A [Lates calcarifer]|uniref:V-type proton ATPase subunit C n=1 Tax=Lates calcarifer TaxID=8187 RepID=A0AAJ7LEF0_LATCA|nr:V-type proton ATPase subunit C 1-A [Lates calcarifer]